MLTAEELVRRQFEAYNARNLERFLENFSETITAYRLPSLEPVLVGKRAFGDFYATQRFSRPQLRAELLNRMLLGNKVVDHERITGVSDEPFEMVVVFEIHAGLIQTVWVFSP
jgi:hypothetical protein